MEWIKIFESEKEALSTLKINSLRKIKVADKEFCLIRNLKGIFVTSDSCSHDLGELSLGKCTPSGAIECPWHHYLFDPISGECINHECGKLETFTVRIDENGVYFKS